MSKSAIESAIIQGLAPLSLEIRDRSRAHATHEGADEGGHYECYIVSAAFEGLPPLARHRMVYELVKEVPNIHALSLRTLTPAEAASQPPKRVIHSS
ncbi:MAG: BolA family transcriptional regulator [Acidithiobacillus sp.]|nr:BolA family transcriptional regulator [Acidithiobacillus sp.]